MLLAAASWSHVHPRVAFVEHRGVGPAAEVRVAVSADDAGFMRGELGTLLNFSTMPKEATEKKAD